MKKKQFALLTIAVTSLALVSTALYLQIVERMLPCPLCVLQRYAFILLAMSCLLAMTRPAIAQKTGLITGIIASLSGAGVALHQLYVIAHPSVSCGRDPLQTAVNQLPFAQWFPTVFVAEGMCGTPYDPILGLSIPQWSLTWFVLYTLSLLFIIIKKPD